MQQSTTPAQAITSEAAPTRQSAEAIARTATISDDTRSYLVLLGKLYDCYDEFVSLIARDYGESQADRLASDFECHILKLYQIVEKYIADSITEHLGCYENEI